jgi:hypothetical protein
MKISAHCAKELTMVAIGSVLPASNTGVSAQEYESIIKQLRALFGAIGKMTLQAAPLLARLTNQGVRDVAKRLRDCGVTYDHLARLVMYHHGRLPDYLAERACAVTAQFWNRLPDRTRKQLFDPQTEVMVWSPGRALLVKACELTRLQWKQVFDASGMLDLKRQAIRYAALHRLKHHKKSIQPDKACRIVLSNGGKKLLIVGDRYSKVVVKVKDLKVHVARP